MNYRLIIIFTTLILGLGFINWQAYQREEIVTDGTLMLVPLAPVDPRSLMQGDYMQLNYGLLNTIEQEKIPERGTLVVSVDELHVATFVRMYDSTQPLGPNEHVLKYRRQYGTLLVGPDSFFFQEGQARLFQDARYAELRVSPTGDVMLVGLRNAALQQLGK